MRAVSSKRIHAPGSSPVIGGISARDEERAAAELMRLRRVELWVQRKVSVRLPHRPAVHTVLVSRSGDDGLRK